MFPPARDGLSFMFPPAQDGSISSAPSLVFGDTAGFELRHSSRCVELPPHGLHLGLPNDWRHQETPPACLPSASSSLNCFFIFIYLLTYFNNFPIALSANITAQSGAHPRVFPMVFLYPLWVLFLRYSNLHGGSDVVSKNSFEPQMWKVFLVSCLGSWLFLTWVSCKVKNVGECSIILNTTSSAFCKMSISWTVFVHLCKAVTSRRKIISPSHHPFPASPVNYHRIYQL